MAIVWTTTAAGRAVFSRSRDPLTGELLFDGSTRSWQAAASPLAEKLMLALRTRKGTAARDLDYGLDDSVFENARENSPALIKNAIQSCLRRYVANGSLAEKPVVVIDTYQGAVDQAIVVTISFKDPRGGTGQITGQQA